MRDVPVDQFELLLVVLVDLVSVLLVRLDMTPILVYLRFLYASLYAVTPSTNSSLPNAATRVRPRTSSETTPS